MTILPWPITPRRRPEPPPPREPFNTEVLDLFIADIPGPPNESDDARARRFQMQRAAVHALGPRDGAEAMIAIQCILLSELTDTAHRDASAEGAMGKAAASHAKAFEALRTEFATLLRRFQTRPDHPPLSVPPHPPPA